VKNFVDPLAVVNHTAVIEEGVSVGPFSYVGDSVEVGSHVVIGSRVSISNFITAVGASGARTVISRDALVGDGSVIAGPVVIGKGAIVRPGAVVEDDVPAYAIVAGNPAQVVGYVQDNYDHPQTFVEPPRVPGTSIDVVGCTLTRLPEVVDLRGRLTFAETEQYLPFEPKRMFTVFGVPNRRIRGSHAHHELHELLFCVGGSVKVSLDNGSERSQVVLDNPTLLLHLRPMTWTTQYDYSPDAALIVLCSHKYENDDYIRDYDIFLELVRG